ncbi:MAG: transcription termination/antitermination protein NusA [Dehalococcoidia bacterium]|nr:MAG: transcription termination/antitermination protein NusA [Dehalococcoidia bacterium]
MLAITQLAAEKNLSREIVLDVVEAALVSAFRKNSFAANQEISVKLNPDTGEVTVFANKTVVETVTDPGRELSLDEAKKINQHAELDEELTVEATPKNAGRIAAQTAKQVVLQRLREAERELVFEEFSDRESEIVTGIVQRIEPRQITLDLGRTEGVLPASEQVRTEHYRMGQRLKVYLVEVRRMGRGPQVLVSRTHRNLLRRLLELEVPEIHSGVVELKSIAREAGHRSKIAVAARQQGVDPIGSCVGLRGIRIQNIVNELNGERIDIVEWHPDPATFIANALSPAPVDSVAVNSEEKVATVVVPDRQLSLAIGREGQNARLAARLTGWRIDIKSASVAEAEEAALAEQPPPPEEAVVEEPEGLVEVDQPETAAPEEDVALLAPEELVPEIEAEEALPVEEAAPIEETLVATPAPQLRFAEDILPAITPKPSKKAKKGKKSKGKAIEDDVARGVAKPKARRAPKIPIDDEELEEL